MRNLQKSSIIFSTPEKVDVVLLYFGIFTYFPIILINLFVDNSIFHLYVLFHWIYHYLTCPIFQENIPNFPTLSLSCDKQCVICFDNMKSKAVFLPCQHCFHEKCIMKWFKTKKSLSDYTCPLCRRPVYKIIDYDKLESRWTIKIWLKKLFNIYRNLMSVGIQSILWQTSNRKFV